jgi:signal transduction histidine kinase
VLNGSTDCIKILRLDGTLEFMNANGICLMEIDDFAPLKGKPWASLWPEESRHLLVDAIDNARQGRHSRFEALCPTAKGTPKYWDVSVSPVNEPGGAEWFVSISRDITERVLGVRSLDAALQEQKRLSEALERHRETLEGRIEEALAALRASEAERRETAAALAQSQKMEAVGKLTGGVAHDFNNVLQVIGGNLQLAVQESNGNEALTRRLTCAHEAVERGAKLASQLLAFARRQPLEPVALDISRLLRSSDDMLRRVLGETIELETVVSGGLWNTLADPNHLQNVIVNLAINARDAMEGAGRLTIEAGNAMLDDEYTRHHDDLASGQYVMVAVSDTGCGMTPETLARAFEPFYTTKAEGRGTGLGLSMAYGFMKQTGGHIKLYSEPGHGTTVKLYLPRSMEDEAVRVEAANDPVTGGAETILVVEGRSERTRDRRGHADAARLPGAESCGCPERAECARKRRARRFAVQRRRYARTDAQRRTGSACAGQAAGAGSAVYIGLHRKRDRARWPARSGRGVDQQAVSAGCVGTQGALDFPHAGL